MELWKTKSRTTEEARKALSNFCKAVGTRGDHTVHIFSIPADPERDADIVLSDVITERDQLREALAFAASVIKCGDPWTPTCEEKIGGLLA